MRVRSLNGARTPSGDRTGLAESGEASDLLGPAGRADASTDRRVGAL